MRVWARVSDFRVMSDRYYMQFMETDRTYAKNAGDTWNEKARSGDRFGVPGLLFHCDTRIKINSTVIALLVYPKSHERARKTTMRGPTTL